MNKNKSGKIVETKFGLGTTKNSDELVKNKILVYLTDGRKMLCAQDKIRIIGFYD